VLPNHFALAPSDHVASIIGMAFTVREIESPDPVTRVLAEDAKMHHPDDDIGEKMVLNMGR